MNFRQTDPTARTEISRYLRILSVLVALFASAALAIGLLLDPYGTSPIGLDIEGVNTPRVERHQLDRLIKPFDVVNQKPKTLLIGTSRVKEGFDPDDWKETRFWPVYNLGIDFSSPTESLAVLRSLLPIVPEIETAIIEVNFIHFFRPGPVRVAETPLQLARRLPEAFFSNSMLAASVVTAVKNRGFENATFWLHEDGQAEVHKNAMLGDIENFLSHVVSAQSRNPLPEDLKAQADLFDEIDATCTEHNVECLYAFFPYQPLDLAHLSLAGQWESLARAKRFFAERRGAYDFTLLNRLTNEPYANRMRYWFDVNHFTPEVGRHIAAAMNGTPLTDTP
ncbi:MAG: hypothetical protein JJ899_10545, partial [Alphaproteobacteria bacterium]|nr:hypothetical protein [Alphaproteobacteria bacterium]